VKKDLENFSGNNLKNIPFFSGKFLKIFPVLKIFSRIPDKKFLA